MIQFFKKNIESNKKLRTFEIIVLCLLVFTSIGSVFYGLMQIHKDVGDLQYVQSVMMDRDKDEEDYDSFVMSFIEKVIKNLWYLMIMKIMLN